jgi:hypothetical protein
MTRPDIPRLTTQTIVYSRTGNSPEHDNLLLPNGRTVGETSTEELRPILARFVDGAHTLGRAILVAKYAEVIREVSEAASMKAITEFLKAKDKC